MQLIQFECHKKLNSRSNLCFSRNYLNSFGILKACFTLALRQPCTYLRRQFSWFRTAASRCCEQHCKTAIRKTRSQGCRNEFSTCSFSLACFPSALRQPCTYLQQQISWFRTAASRCCEQHRKTAIWKTMSQGCRNEFKTCSFSLRFVCVF